MKTRKILIACFIIFVFGSIIFFKTRSPKPFDIDEAIENGAVVSTYGKQFNIENLDKFVENVKNCKPDSILVVTYTVEGDPILTTLKFDGKIIKCTEDSSRDKFGGGLGKITNKFDTIEVVKEENYTKYLLLKDNDSIVLLKKSNKK